MFQSYKNIVKNASPVEKGMELIKLIFFLFWGFFSFELFSPEAIIFSINH